MKEASQLEKEYDKNRLEGFVFCAYELKNIINTPITEMIEIFDLHDQVFILNKDQIYKLHVTKENVHKLFLSWKQ